MRQKLPNAETIEQTANAEIDVPLTSKPQLRAYLFKVNMVDVIPESQKKLYLYIRSTLSAGMSDKQKSEVIFPVLIERIARTAVLMDILERTMMGQDIPMTTMGDKFSKSDYNVLQTEHRKCVEAFVNLKFAYETKKKITVLEKIRQEIAE